MKEQIDHIKVEIRNEELEDVKPLVERAHTLFCIYTHTDGCGWGYENNKKEPWTGFAHARWLKHFETIIKEKDITIEEIGKFLDECESLKEKYPDFVRRITLMSP